VPGRFERSFDHSAIKRSCRHCRQIIAQPLLEKCLRFGVGERQFGDQQGKTGDHNVFLIRLEGCGLAGEPRQLGDYFFVGHGLLWGKLGRLPSTTNQTKEILKASKKEPSSGGHASLFIMENLRQGHTNGRLWSGIGPGNLAAKRLKRNSKKTVLFGAPIMFGAVPEGTPG
jgi:hypothetical protein